MSNQQGTIEILAQELVKLLQPLKDDLKGKRAKVLFAELGFFITESQINAIKQVLNNSITSVNELIQKSLLLTTAIKDKNNNNIIKYGRETISEIKSVINSFAEIRNSISSINLPGTTPDAIAKIPEKLFSYLLVRYLERLKGVTPVISFLDILRQSEENIGSSNPNKPPYTLSTFHFNKIGDWLSKPANQLSSLYKWGHASFDGKLLFEKLEDILSRQAIPVIYNDAEVPSLDLIVIEVVPKTDVTPKGIILRIKNEFNKEFKTEEDDYTLEFKMDFDFPFNTELLIQPNGNIAFTPPTASPLNGKVLFNLAVEKKPDPEPVPYILIGQTGKSRLEFMGFNLKSGTDFTWETSSASGKFLVEAIAKGGKLIIDVSEGDSFLSKILPVIKIESSFDIGLGFSSETGIYFKGSSALETKLPTHFNIGPASLEGLTLALKPRDGRFPIELGADIKGALGPVTVVIENMGFTTAFSFPPDYNGNLGPVQLDMGFKPPNGVGISINAGAVTGGGYLRFDPDKQQYDGILELTIAGFISAKAIGLITTKMPDGRQGFSMLIIITAEFNPPFQLGYGFTLNAVGGLLGLNRTVLLDPLREGVRTGAVNNIMFPANVIANAPRIISDLKTIFPPSEGRFLIGPMAKIGWGTPTLISISFGLIIEIPGRIAILGVLKIILPDERAAIVKIQVAFAGTIDFDKKMLTFDASLIESTVLAMTMEGDMAVRLGWGDQPAFILSIGGFHPSFTPPPLALPTLRRLALNILNTSVAKIRAEYYMAVTSNTVQFGAKADIHFDLRACSIDGDISFDALFQFNPFYFIIELSAGFKMRAAGISVCSVRVKMSLEGPTPWHAKGTGKVSFFFFSISASFDKTWGEQRNTSLPSIAILPQFLQELRKKSQWSTRLVTGKHLLVSLRKTDETTGDTLILHPAGSLVVLQKLVPLDIDIHKIGNQKAGDIKQLRIESAASNGVALSISPVNENFARAQYQELSNADKLSKPSFEKLKGGVEISMGSAVKNGKMVRRRVAYEVTVIDKEPVKPLDKGKLLEEKGVLFNHFLKGNSISKSKLSQSYRQQLQPFAEKADIKEEAFTVAYQADNKIFSAQAVFDSEAKAQTFMQEQIKNNPRLKKQIHIVSQLELQPA